MKKSLGVKPYLFPMPVLMIATYDENGTVDVMNMAWGGICSDNMVALNIFEGHKTSENIKNRKAFTISVADIDHMAEADFFGMVSASDDIRKFERTGMHALKSENVDAPIIEEFPLTLECKVVEAVNTPSGFPEIHLARVLLPHLPIFLENCLIHNADILPIPHVTVQFSWPSTVCYLIHSGI
ncbi:MAG: flavin reductase [Parasporobacterium sp.]|nr:flavin reductase [Parasporobacterium sp.]